jgi:hypothetical protein
MLCPWCPLYTIDRSCSRLPDISPLVLPRLPDTPPLVLPCLPDTAIIAG